MVVAIGAFLGPMVGGIMNDAYNFKTTTDVMGFSCFSGFLFFTFASIIMELSTTKLKEKEFPPNDDECPLMSD
jgi:hypothetical protein